MCEPKKSFGHVERKKRLESLIDIPPIDSDAYVLVHPARCNMPRFLSFYPLISLYVSFSAFPIWSDGPSDGMPESSIRTGENAERELECA